MKKTTILLIGAIIMIVLVPMINAANTDVPVDDTLRVQFGNIDNCINDDLSGSANGTMIFQIEEYNDNNDHYTLARYSIGCFNQSVSVIRVDPGAGLIDVGDSISSGDRASVDTMGENDRDEIISTFIPPYTDAELNTLCSGNENFGSSDSLNSNLSFCYGALQTVVSNQKVCEDNAELKGQYGAQFEACQADFSECSVALAPLKEERDSCNSEKASCTSELDSKDNILNSCQGDLKSCNTEKETANTKAGQNIIWGIGGIILGLIAMSMINKNKVQHPGQSQEEREFDWDQQD